MKKTISVLILIAALCLSLSAQDARTLIKEDPSRIACQLHHYEVPAFADTPAPKGFKPFYVSHFGRHGSRYLSNQGKYESFYVLDTLSAKGLLTEEGERLRKDMDLIAEYHYKMDGILTQVGSKEHQGVAARLYQRCPEVFNQKDRKEVLAVSSTVVRCIQSMTNFCSSLKGKSPKLDFSFYTNYRTDEALVRTAKGRRIYEGRNPDEVFYELLAEHMNMDRAMKAFFKDPEAAKKYMKKHDEKRFFFDFIDAAVIEQCLDEDAPKVYPYFTDEELYNFWIVKNAKTLDSHGFCYENGASNYRRGQYCLRDIIAKADEALLPGSHKAADFRFSHDSQTMPLIFTIGLGKNNKVYSMGKETQEGWYAFQNICMCTNLQMIFYKNRKGEVLVKFLHNEKESTISELEPYSGPYYRWTDLRPYLVSRCEGNYEL